jgi:membrane-bound inhibitor of C-type lysozyme
VRAAGLAVALLLSACATNVAQGPSGAAQATAYTCADGSVVEAAYPSTNTAKLVYKSQPIDMHIAISASGARYIGGGWQWWTKGMTQGWLAPLAPGETIASAQGMSCTAK